MRVLIQRVSRAKVAVDGKDIAQISGGLLLLAGFGKDDGTEDIMRMAKKIAALRIFEDTHGKMNLNVIQAKGQILSVPQFTLYADTQKGNRPGFELSADPDEAESLWKRFNELLTREGLEVRTGHFGAHMEVGLVNDGPVTIWIDSKI